ncbi:F-box protein At1g11270-like [Papaver somniferum]|uniref:F-box protein At1g11270-like n=1 Tax=Papaver somniferum TaxID=3469 RepID=UPI000E70500D|nr:F-box protein At1g11270-like [Papaver somniferum]
MWMWRSRSSETRGGNTRSAKRRRVICVDYNNADHIDSSLIIDDDFVVFQILSRLPVKSLMRFKCVCKSWKSIIEHDAHFINLHHSLSEARPGFLIVVPSTAGYSQDHTRGYESFLSGNLHFDSRGVKIHTVRKIQSISNLTTLGPIRGFICLPDIFAVQIYNVSTGEVTPWIKSSVFTNVEKENVILKVYEQPECYFGFDPSTGKHKVIFLWYAGRFKKRQVCEVLTVGDNMWRIIDDAPPCKPNGNISACENGSIYWFMYSGIAPWIRSNDYVEAVE